MEVFRDIEGYEGYYQATSFGKIWSVPRVTTQGKKVGGYYLKYSNTNKRHYNRVELRKDGCDKLFFEHTLIARAFPEICGEWFDGADIHHKNNNSIDNRPENLIVLSKEAHKALHAVSDITYYKRSYAQKNAWEVREKRYGHKKPVYQYTKDGEFLKEYPSAKEAAIETKTNYPSLSECLHGKNKTAGGYVWKFVN